MFFFPATLNGRSVGGYEAEMMEAVRGKGDRAEMETVA